MTAAESVPDLVQIGETLRAAREGRGLTPDQAAARLRCDVRVIEALEAGRFAEVGPPVFARGHLLRYAQLLGEPGEAMVAAWAQTAGGSAAGELMADTHPRPVRDLRQLRRRLVTGTALLCAAIVAVWSLQQLGSGGAVAPRAATETPPRTAPAPTPGVADAAGPAQQAPPAEVRAEVQPAAPVPGTAGDAPAVSRPAAAAVADAAPAPQPASAPARARAAAASVDAAPATEAAPAVAARVASARLAVTASEESWLEVYDRRNRRLFFGVARPGALVDVRGNLPLRVVVGNVPATTFEVDGRRVEVPREAMRGRRAATFRVGPDGRLTAWPRA